MAEDDFGDLMSYVDWESKSGDWDINGPQPSNEQWYGVQFERKAEAVYFKTKFDATVVEWDESGTEPRTKEELLEQGYVHGKLKVIAPLVPSFLEWCDERQIGIVDEIKLFSKNEPFNIYTPTPELLDETIKLWNERTVVWEAANN